LKRQNISSCGVRICKHFWRFSTAQWAITKEAFYSYC